mgnify:CR=1 FL=1
MQKNFCIGFFALCLKCWNVVGKSAFVWFRDGGLGRIWMEVWKNIDRIMEKEYNKVNCIVG